MSFFESLKCLLGMRASRKTARRRTVRLQLEVLEARCVPATSTWVGAAMTGAGDWSDPTNKNLWAGAVPVAADTALFNQVASAPQLSGLVTIANLSARSVESAGTTPFTTTLDLNGKALTVSGLTAVFAVDTKGPAVRTNVPDAVFTLNSGGGMTSFSTDTLNVGYDGKTMAKR